MKPSEKIKQLRGEMSRPKFGEKYGVPAYTIKYIEEETQAIPDDLALKLEAEYGIPFKWWKTGEGPMTLEEQKEKATPECPRWLDRLTESELKELEKIAKEDKSILLMFLEASTGDENKIIQLCKLLEIKFGVKISK